METFGICLYTLIPIRSNPSESSEMVTQLLFGETYKVINKEDKWFEIEISFDKYIGWMDAKLFHRIDEEYIKSSKTTTNIAFTHLLKNNQKQFLLGGSELPANKTSFQIGQFNFKHQIDTKPNSQGIIELAKSYLNAPYLWGGKSILGIDCSGLTQITFKANNISLPRDASQQMQLGQEISFINQVQAGDLAFFDNKDGKITHVGIIVSSNEIIHASGAVRMDRIDHQGIFNSDTNSYSHKLRIIKRLTPNE